LIVQIIFIQLLIFVLVFIQFGRILFSYYSVLVRIILLVLVLELLVHEKRWCDMYVIMVNMSEQLNILVLRGSVATDLR